MIQIVGPQLSQWDTGRSISVSGSNANYAHLANRGDSHAVIMELVEGEAKIPDYLLQTGKELCIYLVLDGITQESKSFYVQKRARPENYVYEDDRRNYIYELITEALAATKNANQAAANAKKYIDNLDNVSAARLANVTLLASAWEGSNSLYSQTVTIDGITEYSKVDLLPSVEQLVIFHNKDVAFVTENENGVVTVYAIGEKPTLDYTMQVSITEVIA